MSARRARGRSGRVIVVGSAVLALVLAACGGAEDDGAPESADEAEAPEEDEAEAPEEDEAEAPEEDEATEGELSMEELIEAAEAEGQLTWYTADTTATAESMVEAFEAEFDIDVELLRAGGEQIMARVETELAAGALVPDLISYSSEASAINHQQRGVVTQYHPMIRDEVDGWDEELVDPDGYFTVPGVFLATFAYNTDIVSEDEAPTAWADLYDERWADEIVTASPEYAGAAVAMTAGIEQHIDADFLQKWGANQVSVAQGFGNSEDLIVSGERPVGTVLSIRAALAMEAGQPLEMVYPEEGAVLVRFGAQLVDEADNSNAAMLFINFLLSETGQQIYVDNGFYAARPGMDSPAGLRDLDDVDFVVPDAASIASPEEIAALNDRWIDGLGGLG